MDMHSVISKLVLWIEATANIPNALLIFLIALSAWVLRTAQKNEKFEIGLMLVDENGKPSSSRFAVLICLGITSYILIYAFVNKSVGENILLSMFYAYIVTWAASKSIEKIIDAWACRRNGGTFDMPTVPGFKKTVESVSTSTETTTKP